MTITMHTTHTPTIEEMRAFIDGSASLAITVTDTAEAYDWICRVLRSTGYTRLGKPDKGVVREYLMAATGYRRAQITRLIAQYAESGRIVVRTSARHRFPAVYTDEDVAALAEMDEAHQRLSGPATKHLCQRAFRLFGDSRYDRLRTISVSHLYNLRHSDGYERRTVHYTKTTPADVPIGRRTKPEPKNRPGNLRVDSVHQGDMEGDKGVYHINLVDEVTQWEIVVCVEGISERFMIPALEAALEEFPFHITNFHTDNGSEYINRRVADLLNRMHVTLTKSRPRHSGDNGLAETKNGAIVRKALGYAHIPRTPDNAAAINRWYADWLVPYLNYHRPCAFRTTTVDPGTGKRVHSYPHGDYMTPYEKLKSLDGAEGYLRDRVTFAMLDEIAYAMSDTDWALSMDAAKYCMFKALQY